jgi:hypothetical protein
LERSSAIAFGKYLKTQFRGGRKMTLKKALENRVRGWIPKEPSLPISQMKAAALIKTHPVNIWNPLWIASSASLRRYRQRLLA